MLIDHTGTQVGAGGCEAGAKGSREHSGFDAAACGELFPIA